MAKVLAYYAVFTPLSTLLGEYLAGTLGWNEYLVKMCIRDRSTARGWTS